MYTALILAGGLGTRLRSEVSDVPKPMAPINGRPFLEWLMDYWINQGVERFVLSVGYMSDIIQSHFGHKYRNCSVEYSVENAPLGTGGGVLKAVKGFEISEPFILLNGDTFFEVDLSLLLKKTENQKDNHIVFSLMKTTNTQRYMGVDYDIDQQKIDSLTPQSSDSYVYANGGVYLISPQVLQTYGWDEETPVSLEHEVFPFLFNKNADFSGISFNDARFIDIGVPEDYRRASKVICVGEI